MIIHFCDLRTCWVAAEGPCYRHAVISSVQIFIYTETRRVIVVMQSDITTLSSRWYTQSLCAPQGLPRPHSKLYQSVCSRRLGVTRNSSNDVASAVSLNGTPESLSERAPVVAAPTVQGETELIFQRAETAKYEINIIPQSRWPDGIPVVMGAHLMASGAVAPISTSKGAGICRGQLKPTV